MHVMRTKVKVDAWVTTYDTPGGRDTALVRCDLCVNGGGVLADVCGASDVWCTGL